MMTMRESSEFLYMSLQESLIKQKYDIWKLAVASHVQKTVAS